MDVEGADDDHDAAAMPAAAHPADLHPFLGGLLTPPEDERGGRLRRYGAELSLD